MAQLIIPPWLRPAAPAENAYQAGAQLGQQMAAREQANELAQREEMRREQEDLIQQEYHQQTIRLAQQQEEREQEKFQMAAEQVARKYAAQQAYTEAVESGVPPEQALAHLGPELGLTGAGLGQAIRAATPFVPQPPIQVPGGAMYNEGPQRWQFAKAPMGQLPPEPLPTAPITGEGGEVLPGRAYRSATGAMLPLPAQAIRSGDTIAEKRELLHMAESTLKRISDKYKDRHATASFRKTPEGEAEYQNDQADLLQAKALIQKLLPGAPIGGTNAPAATPQSDPLGLFK